jgi:hypothetical protein
VCCAWLTGACWGTTGEHPVMIRPPPLAARLPLRRRGAPWPRCRRSGMSWPCPSVLRRISGSTSASLARLAAECLPSCSLIAGRPAAVASTLNRRYTASGCAPSRPRPGHRSNGARSAVSPLTATTVRRGTRREQPSVFLQSVTVRVCIVRLCPDQATQWCSRPTGADGDAGSRSSKPADGAQRRRRVRLPSAPPWL